MLPFNPGRFGRSALDSAGGGGGLGLQTNLSAFWQFENTSWTDELSVNNLTGTNSPTSVSGLVGNAVKFTSGSAMELHHASATALVLGGGNFSFQVWVNCASPPDYLISKNDGGFGNHEYAIGTRFSGGNVWTWRFYDSASSIYNVDSSTAFASGWHHVVGTWDGTTQKIYVDAGTASTATPGAVPNAATSNFLIDKDGASGAFASATQDVLIDQVGLWKSRVLSAADVTALYNGGAGLSYAAMA